MDHVPQTAQNPHPPVQVPYLVTDKFQPIITDYRYIHTNLDYNDGDDDDDDTAAGAAFLVVTHSDDDDDDESKTTTQIITQEDEILSFYQARCFFGLLYDVYSVAGKQEEFEVGMYVDRDGRGEKSVVTTKVLLRELDGILLKERPLSDEEKVRKFEELQRFIQAAQNLTAQLQRYVAERLEEEEEENGNETENENEDEEDAEHMSDDSSLQEICVWQVVTESTAMLSETILSAARQIYLPSSAVDASLLAPLWGRDLPPAPESSFYMKRFQKARWCPRDVAEITETVMGSRSVLLSLSSIDKTSEVYGNHEHCSEKTCLLECIDNDTYEPLHAPACWDTSCPLVPEAAESGSDSASTIIARVVQKGWIPVVCVVEKPGSYPLLSIKAHEPAHKHNGSVRKRKRPDSEIDTMEWTVKLCEKGQKVNCTEERTEGPTDSGSQPDRWTLADMAKLLNPEDADDGGIPYVAISHVWAQGLGNRDINALPLCQLRRIQGFVNLMVPENQRPMPFWIDTICVPLDPATRSMAIKEMRTVYRDASAVLVIDRTLMEVDLVNDQAPDIEGSGFANSQLELLMRIKASPWAQRLWTYHEAWLAKELYFQISEADVPAISSTHLAVPKWRATFDFFDPGEHAQERERQAEPHKEKDDDRKQDEALGLESASLMLPLEYTAGYLCVQAGTLQLFGRSSSESDFQGFHSDLRGLSDPLMLRTTSRLQDEAICLSALLGLEAAAVMTDDYGKTVPDEDRMRRLWEILAVDDIPAEIIFCNRPIYGDQGCGWMPRSLLRDDRGNMINYMRCGQAMKKDAEHGILVEVSAVCFEIPENAGLLVSPWNVVLRISDYNYRLTDAKATAPMPGWRSSFRTGNFAVLMPESELRMLLENAKDRVDGSGSHSTHQPFGLLVNILDSPVLQSENYREAEHDVCYVLRRETVEFETVFDHDKNNDASEANGQSSDAEGDKEDAESLVLVSEGEAMLFVDGQVFERKTRKWWVG